MIDFRYHLVSLVSVFIALAVGIVLGAGPLRGQIASTLQTQVDNLRTQKEQLELERKTAETGVKNRDSFSQAVLPSLVAQQLGGRSVVLVALPGVDGDAVKSLATTLQAAGARITGRITLKNQWTAPDGAQARQKLADEWKGAASPSTVENAPPSPSSSPSPSSLGPTAVRSGASRVGAASAAASSAPSLSPSAQPTVPQPSATQPTATAAAVPVDGLLDAELARALVSTELAAAETEDPTGKAILDAFGKAGLLSIDGDQSGRATGVVVLAPAVQEATLSGALSAASPSPSPSGAVDTGAIWTALSLTLDRAGDGAVVVGPASAATPGGVIESVRSTADVAKEVSTVDTGGAPMGDITTVLALREQLSGASGAYGFGPGASAPLPGQGNQ